MLELITEQKQLYILCEFAAVTFVESSKSRQRHVLLNSLLIELSANKVVNCFELNRHELSCNAFIMLFVYKKNSSCCFEATINGLDSVD